ncbi:hypothetical protein [Nonomuraea angiospora]|uniref:hypothetical protein n=1 Tax=Nonomuraea angiospora TaxID=46172 RepID=UPI0029AB81EF|nr:hypothetical protein [Nonomuraea angiospora]MDX3110153.1 hypothetical protein [Nonomuraea angiospora]
MTIPDEVAADFVSAFDSYCAYDVAVRLNCGEVEALANLFTALGSPDLAATWIDAHAEDDDEGDLHHLN